MLSGPPAQALQPCWGLGSPVPSREATSASSVQRDGMISRVCPDALHHVSAVRNLVGDEQHWAGADSDQVDYVQPRRHRGCWNRVGHDPLVRSTRFAGWCRASVSPRRCSHARSASSIDVCPLPCCRAQGSTHLRRQRQFLPAEQNVGRLLADVRVVVHQLSGVFQWRPPGVLRRGREGGTRTPIEWRRPRVSAQTGIGPMTFDLVTSPTGLVNKTIIQPGQSVSAFRRRLCCCIVVT